MISAGETFKGLSSSVIISSDIKLWETDCEFEDIGQIPDIKMVTGKDASWSETLQQSS